ncbi:MAG: hypothetical protein ACJAUD_002858 [Crocinitomicaceae bacterium]|jgi:hypothetical protein
MKKLFLVTILAGASMLNSCVESTTDEKKQDVSNEVKPDLEEEEDELFLSEDGHFSINFLGGNPDDIASVIPTDVGNVEMHTLLHEKSVTEALMVAYSDYPSESVNESNSAELLEGARNGAIENLEISAPEIEEKIELDGHPGLYFTGNNGRYYVTYNVFLVGNRLYQVAALRDGSYASDQVIDDFIGSFKLTDENEEG